MKSKTKNLCHPSMSSGVLMIVRLVHHLGRLALQKTSWLGGGESEKSSKVA